MISKTKMYGFNPHTDQIDGVNQVMEETGEKSESAILRKLLDEALAARRLKAAEAALSELPFGQGFGEMLRAVQTLLAKLVRQGETSLRMQDLSLVMLQETLAASLADQKTTWTLVESTLKQRGLTDRDWSSLRLLRPRPMRRLTGLLSGLTKVSAKISTRLSTHRA